MLLLLQAAIRDGNPVVFLENELVYGETFPVEEDMLKYDWQLEIGKAHVEREGTDITICSHSRGVGFAMKAAEELAAAGISAEVCVRQQSLGR